MYNIPMNDIAIHRTEGYRLKRAYVITVRNKILAVTGKNNKEEIVSILTGQLDKKLGRRIESRLKEIINNV